MRDRAERLAHLVGKPGGRSRFGAGRFACQTGGRAIGIRTGRTGGVVTGTFGNETGFLGVTGTTVRRVRDGAVVTGLRVGGGSGTGAMCMNGATWCNTIGWSGGMCGAGPKRVIGTGRTIGTGRVTGTGRAVAIAVSASTAAIPMSGETRSILMRTSF